jgi:hypothetical protein
MTAADSTAWAYAHASWVGAVAGWLVPTPRHLWRLLSPRLLAFIESRKDNPMQNIDPKKIVTAAINATKLAAAAYSLELAVKAAPDVATERALIVAGAAEIVTDLVNVFGADGPAIAAYATPELVGELFDFEEYARAFVAKLIAARAAQAAAAQPAA